MPLSDLPGHGQRPGPKLAGAGGRRKPAESTVPRQSSRRARARCCGGLCALLAVSICQGVLAQGDLEALDRVDRFRRLYEEPLQSASLVVEASERQNLTPAMIDRVLADLERAGGSGGLSVQEAEARRTRLQESLAQEFTRRFVLMTDFVGRYRSEVMDQMVGDLEEGAPLQQTYQTMTVQGPEGHFNVNHTQRYAELRHRQLPHDAFNVHATPTGWGLLDIFLQAPALMSQLRNVRAAEPAGEFEGLRWARVRTRPEGVTRLYVGYSASPEAAAGPIQVILETNPGARSARRHSFGQWLPATPSRPTSVVIECWEDVDAAGPANLNELAATPPLSIQRITALSLELNRRLGDSLFVYEPPEDYVYVEEKPDGSFEFLQHPGFPLSVQGPSPRQERIRERLEEARTPARIRGVLLGLGAALLVAGAFIRLRAARA